MKAGKNIFGIRIIGSFSPKHSHLDAVAVSYKVNSFAAIYSQLIIAFTDDCSKWLKQWGRSSTVEEEEAKTKTLKYKVM